MNRAVSIILIVLAAAFIWLAGAWNRPLLDERTTHHLTSVSPLENAPPLLAITAVALGGFRGLIADTLWLRASHLQEKGQYFEVVQLSDWITKLEPKATEIWAFHSWNMAYNISIAMPSYKDRWRWVMNGIRLLRDEGIIYNPGDPDLYHQLGWLFQHKLGMTTDTAHKYYRKMWAAEMEALLSGPRPDYDNLDAETERNMKEDYKLLPDIMQHIENTYGAMDWRRPEPHALYWAYLGIHHTGDTDNIPCNRMINQSLNLLRKNIEEERESAK
jgi:hypothetical protein